jgi:hypothetical protein
MAITFESSMEDGVLIITTSGRDENLQQVLEYGQAVIDLVVATGATRILCDERNLEYAIDTIDTYDAAKAVAEHASKAVRIAIVCGPNFLEDGKFFETVAVNRNLRLRVDTDIAKARAWLLGKGE